MKKQNDKRKEKKIMSLFKLDKALVFCISIHETDKLDGLNECPAQ